MHWLPKSPLDLAAAIKLSKIVDDFEYQIDRGTWDLAEKEPVFARPPFHDTTCASYLHSSSSD